MTRRDMVLRPFADRRVQLACALLMVLALTAAVVLSQKARSKAAMRAHIAAAQRLSKPVTIALPAPDLLRSLTPEEAVAENAKRAAAARPDQAAVSFRPKFVDDGSRARALECMTQAVYYEAATEPLAGREAVAQVILNRVHHPAFPGSVCGVVYQGSERSTGCQFTFACDGSLRRPPASALWNAARAVAAQALAGKVFAPVGHATHYHADYVLPYWADSLDKEVQIGRHIFYRLKGGLGAPRTFSQGYRGLEPVPLTPTDVEVAANAIGAASKDEVPSGLTDIAGVDLPPALPKPPPLAADASHGQLLIDESLVRPLGGPASNPAVAAADRCNSVPPTSTKAVAMNNRIGSPATGPCR